MKKDESLSLTPEQEVILKENEPLVRHVLKGFNFIEHPTRDYDDFYQCGMIALCRAVKTFDASKGWAFSTYAHKCITNALIRELKLNNEIARNEAAYASVDTLDVFTGVTDGMTTEESTFSSAAKILAEDAERKHKEEMEAIEYRDIISNVLNNSRLSPATRRNVILALKVANGLSIRTEAKRQGVSHQAVFSKVDKGRKYLAGNAEIKQLRHKTAEAADEL